MSSFVSGIVTAMTSTFTDLGKAILALVKTGFVELFCDYTESNGVITITGPSALAYYAFVLGGIAIVCGITSMLVHMVRRSR